MEQKHGERPALQGKQGSDLSTGAHQFPWQLLMAEGITE